jgi:aminomethyltransferase
MAGKKTPLYEAHRQAGAKIIDFGGWDMPVSYPAGTIKEHKAVREAVGLFDVSHMGEVYMRGPKARETVAKLTTNACESAPPGKAVYTLLCTPSGGVVDDCIFYKRADDDFMVIVNASNIAKDIEWFREHASTECDVVDVSDATALIAVQGPKAVAMVDKLAGGSLAQMPSFTFKDAEVAGVKCVVARTGYTGEDGFELACRNQDAMKLWGALMEAATPLGGLPIGLGARDTLRLEGKLSLYGNDLDDQTTPLEADLGWVVKLDGPADFIGKAALLEQRAQGVKRKLVGFEMTGRGIARHGYAIQDAKGAALGTVTSGGPAPTLEKNIGMGYVPLAASEPGTELQIDCRGKLVPAVIVKGPFYKRGK